MLTPHPLVFRFQTNRVIYPMRLTGAVNTGDLSLERDVFANSRASVDGMETRFSRRITGTNVGFNINDPKAHPAIASLASGTTILTMLRGTFTRDDMKRDIIIDWRKPSSYLTSVYGRQDAVALGILIALGLWTIAALVAKLPHISRSPVRRRQTIPASLLVAPLAGVITFAAVEKSPLAPWTKNPIHMVALIGGAAQSIADDATRNGQHLSLDEFKDRVRSKLAELEPNESNRPFEENSPGNYTIKDVDGKHQVSYYTQFGTRQIDTY